MPKHASISKRGGYSGSAPKQTPKPPQSAGASSNSSAEQSAKAKN